MLPGFGPAAEVLLLRQKDPKPGTPRPASLGWEGPKLFLGASVPGAERQASDSGKRERFRKKGEGGWKVFFKDGQNYKIPMALRSTMKTATGAM